MLGRNQKLHEKSQYRHKNMTNGWKDEREKQKKEGGEVQSGPIFGD